jgi:hypothetical protein
LPGGDGLLARLLYREPLPGRSAHAAYLAKFLALASARDIPVYWLMPPFDPEVLAERERRGLEASYTRFALAVQARFPNVVVLDGRRLGYDASSFDDAVHLNPRGASAFTAEVASALAPEPPRRGPRWIELGHRATTSLADFAFDEAWESPR